MSDIASLRSGALGYFLLTPQIIACRSPKSLLEKAGLWREGAITLSLATPLDGWATLNKDEKIRVLTYYHEFAHFLDITSLPAGLFLWRLMDATRSIGAGYVQFIKDLDLNDAVSFPLTTWLCSAAARQHISSRLLGLKKLGKYLVPESSIPLVLNDYCVEGLRDAQSMQYLSSVLIHDPKPQFFKCYRHINRCQRYFKARFEEHGVFGLSEYERLPDLLCSKDRSFRGNSDTHFLSLAEIFELRAYINELRIIRLHGDEEFVDDWLERLKDVLSERALGLLRDWAKKRYLDSHFMYITDLALSGTIDVLSCFYASRPLNADVEYGFYRNWPSHRLARILNWIFGEQSLLNLWDPNHACAERYTVLGQHLFGHETFPFTGIGPAVRPIIPRSFRSPFSGSNLLQSMEEPTQLMTALRRGDSWTAESHREAVYEIFTANTRAYLSSYLGFGDTRRRGPLLMVFDDFVIGFDGVESVADTNDLQGLMKQNSAMSIVYEYVDGLIGTALVQNADPVNFREVLRNFGAASFREAVKRTIETRYPKAIQERFVSAVC